MGRGRHSFVSVSLVSPAVAVAVAVAGVVAALVPVAPAHAIVDGAFDGGRHPYVGALLGPFNLPICSGALVPATSGPVFLTAAHCLGAAGNGTTVNVTFAPLVGTGTVYSGVYHVMPGYNASTGADDVAVVSLASSPAITPVSLGTTVPPPGTVITTVGFGLPWVGFRKNATEIVTRADPTWLYLKPGSGNSCYLDSGGPDLVTAGGRTVVVAITDQGSCHDDQDFLVTSPRVQAFITAH